MLAVQLTMCCTMLLPELPNRGTALAKHAEHCMYGILETLCFKKELVCTPAL